MAESLIGIPCGSTPLLKVGGSTAHLQTDSFFVTGMQCGGCTIKLSLALRMLAGVDDVQISLASGEVTVVYDAALVSPARIQETVIGTGFGTAGVAATNGHDPRSDQCG
jgi:copper chaperone